MAGVIVIPPPGVLPSFTPRQRAVRVERTRTVDEGSFDEAVAYEDGTFASIREELMSLPVATLTFRHELAVRRQALEAFAERFAAEDDNRQVRFLFDATRGGRPSRFEVLDAVGAILTDDDSIDREALIESGARIYEDVPVELVAPVAYAEADPQPADAEPWHLAKINIGAARSRGLTGKGVLIGVLDTGIDASHPDLSSVLAGPGAFAEFDTDGIVSATPHEASPDATHGTHVCGLIAGRTHGIAPDAHLAVAAVLTVKDRFTGQYRGGLKQITRGLNWLLRTEFEGQLPDVINVSHGRVPYDDFLYRTTADARDRGVIVVAAVGNTGKSGENGHLSPANYDIAVGVGATDADDVAADFSDWGTVSQHGNCPKPDLCAPGVQVWSCVRGGGYGWLDGTSMAAPLVTGAAALLIEQRNELRSDPDALLGALFALVGPATPSPRVGRGRLDLSRI